MIWIVTCSNGDEMAVWEIYQPHAFRLAERMFNNSQRHVTNVRCSTTDEAERYAAILSSNA